MENKQEYYFNSKLYDQKSRRISVFGRQIGDKLEIWELKCSKSDNYNRKLAQDLYRSHRENEETSSTYHPTIYKIAIKEGNSAKHEFRLHCLFNYLHKFEEEKLEKRTFLGKFIELEGFKRVKTC